MLCFYKTCSVGQKLRSDKYHYISSKSKDKTLMFKTCLKHAVLFDTYLYSNPIILKDTFNLNVEVMVISLLHLVFKGSFVLKDLSSKVHKTSRFKQHLFV